MGLEPYLLLQFPEHRLFWRLIRIYPSLGELPRVLSNPATPEKLAPIITKDDTDIGSITL